MVDRPEDYKNEIEFMQGVVGKKFPIYRTEVEFDIVKLYVRILQGEDFDDRFDDLRRELVPQNYVPFLTEEGGEYIISIKKQPEQKFRTVKANVVMLLITISTALIAGAWQWNGYDPSGGGFFSVHNVLNGALFFTLPLLTILGIHEMGHYLTARYHNIKASLPFFLPAPPPLGTIGAFISIREPIPDKNSLLDLGVSGPICGFLVAIPVSIIGLWLGGVADKPIPTGIEGTFMAINFPLIMILISSVLDMGQGALFHPTAFAGWVGFLVTGLNLLPAGQLDGGHVVKALAGDKAKYPGYVAVAFLLIVGLWWYQGWLIFAFFILFFVGLKHPPPLNELGKLDNKRKVIGVFAVVMLFISFHPVPIETVSYDYDMSVDVVGDQLQNASLNETLEYALIMENTGDPNADDYNISYSVTNSSWNVQMKKQILNESGNVTQTSWKYLGSNRTSIRLKPGENRTFIIETTPYPGSANRTDIDFKVRSNTTGDSKVVRLTSLFDYRFQAEVVGDRVKMTENGEAEFVVNVTNLGRTDSYYTEVEHITNESWDALFSYEDRVSDNLTFTVRPDRTATFSLILSTEDSLTRGVRLSLYRPDQEGTDEETKAGVELVTIHISVTSKGSGEREVFELNGVHSEG